MDYNHVEEFSRLKIKKENCFPEEYVIVGVLLWVHILQKIVAQLIFEKHSAWTRMN